MKKPKKRYEHISQINDDIERYRKKAEKFRNSAEAQDIKADTIARSTDAHLNAELIGFTRAQAAKARRSAFNIETKKMVKLKEKLAEFQTEPLPGIVPDRSTQR